jgi:hypothetical protein
MKVRHRRSPRNRHGTAAVAKRRLRWMLALFFITLTLPLYLLTDKVYSQLEHEAYYRYRRQAEALVDSIEQRLQNVLEAEQQRPFAQYSFFNVLENPLLPSTGITFSPLSKLPLESDVPGVIGYFQIDPDDSFHSPVLPDFGGDRSTVKKNGFSPEQWKKRLALRNKLRRLLLAGGETAPDAQRRRKERGSRDVQEERESAGDGGRKKDASKAGDERYAFEDLFRLYDTIGRRTSEEWDADESRASSGRGDEDAKRVSPLQLAELKGVGRKADEALSTKTADVASSPAPPRVPAAQYRRKEKVRIPDQAAARALFDRPRRQASASARWRLKSAGGAAEAKSQQASAAVANRGFGAASEKHKGPVAILSFDSEIDRLQMMPLNSSYDCFFRRIWRDDGRYIQGFIVERSQFLRQMIEALFRGGPIASVSRLLVAYDGNVVRQVGPFGYETPSSSARLDEPAEPKEEMLLFRARLDDPLQRVELLFSVGELPLGQGVLLIDSTALVLAAVLLIGLVGFYRLGVR